MLATSEGKSHLFGGFGVQSAADQNFLMDQEHTREQLCTIYHKFAHICENGKDKEGKMKPKREAGTGPHFERDTPCRSLIVKS